MTQCAVCQSSLSQTSRFCSTCGTPVHGTTPTVAGVRTGAAATVGTRFQPGVTLAGRYRIIGLLGRGGMGEVYRADDLKLDQAVALKFLPEALASDAAALAAFHSEVRLARQISHPNLCRVYDIGEVDGHHFLSMEFVDGEDLASLLRRIGRLPLEKAVEFTREMCAGLQAAHDKGVLHRDLKPSNIMIDGRGDARIADFGLAGLAGRFHEKDIFAGTPAYMAPEQLAGTDVTARSDIYSIGLILYEMVTGKRTFEAESLVELIRKHEEDPPVPPSEYVSGLDPVVETVILRCLEKEPAKRPSSPLAVAAALPGGDPLAAALAAGQTPSPEMVAAAGEMVGIPRRKAWTLFGAALLALLAVFVVNDRIFVHRMIDMPKQPAVLEDRAREILAGTGFRVDPAMTANGFVTSTTYLRWIRQNDPSPERWKRLEKGGPPALLYWYREFPRPVVTLAMSSGGRINLGDPDFSNPRNAQVMLDPAGRLISVALVPPRYDDSLRVEPEPDWSRYFELAGLDMTRFTPTASAWNPSYEVQDRRAWTGTDAAAPDIEFTVEAATYKGRPVRFAILRPWDAKDPAQPVLTGAQRTLATLFTALIVGAILIGGALLAWRNWRSGRADPTGARRLATGMALVALAGWTLHASYPPEVSMIVDMFFTSMAFALLYGGLGWLLYVALEPWARRVWPEMLISWTRLISGKIRDPRVGYDLLVGILAGLLMHVVAGLVLSFTGLFGAAPPQPVSIAPDTLLGGRIGAALVAFGVLNVTLQPFVLLMMFVLFRMLLKKRWAAVLAGTALIVLADLTNLTEPIRVVVTVGLVLTNVALLLRFGFLTTACAALVGNLLSSFPVTHDVSAWYAAGGLPALVVIVGIALFAFRVSLGERRRAATR